MILAEKEFSYSKVEKIIGKPTKIDFKKLNSVGSCSFYLKTIKSEKEVYKELKINSKVNLQQFTDGILVRFHFSNKITFIAVGFEYLDKLYFKRGAEYIRFKKFSLMKTLVDLGIGIRYARYFASNRGEIEYKIEPAEMKIETQDFQLEFITNGYNFESQDSFFKPLKRKTDKIK